MKEPLDGLWQLTRFPEYASFVVVTTILGAAAARGSFGWPFAGVLAANWLAVGFAFMLNDVEDAPDDALNPEKVGRNPVSAGRLSARAARAWSMGVAAAAAGLYALLGWGAFVAGLACLVLGYVYSARPLRLKAVPVADLVSHIFMLAGLQFGAAYLALAAERNAAGGWVLPLLFVLAISLYGQLFNELRDLDGDRAAGVTHTASLIGARPAQALMLAALVTGVAAGLATVWVERLIPVEVLLAIVGLGVLLAGRRLVRARLAASTVELHRPFHKPIEIAAAAVLLVWYASPRWLPYFPVVSGP